MAKLILSVDGQVLKEYTLSKERTLIGRKPHNDIQIDNLAVSGEHAAIITILNDSFIEDLGSTNGTMVNGKPIKKHFLQNNDVVEIGKHKLKYFNDAPAAATAADFEKTMIIRNPAKAAPTPAAGEKSMGDTQTNLKALAAADGTKTVPPAPQPQASAPPPQPAKAPEPAPAAAPAAPAAGALREAAIQVLSGARGGTHARPHQEPHHDRQAGPAGGGHHQAAQRLLHHPRRGGDLSHAQRHLARRPGASAERPRPDRDRGRQDGVLLQAVRSGRAPRSGRGFHPRLPQCQNCGMAHSPRGNVPR